MPGPDNKLYCFMWPRPPCHKCFDVCSQSVDELPCVTFDMEFEHKKWNTQMRIIWPVACNTVTPEERNTEIRNTWQVTCNTRCVSVPVLWLVSPLTTVSGPNWWVIVCPRQLVNLRQKPIDQLCLSHCSALVLWSRQKSKNCKINCDSVN